MSIVDILVRATLKISGTLKRGILVPYLGAKISTTWRVPVISVSFEEYGYLPISPIGRGISDVGLTNLPF